MKKPVTEFEMQAKRVNTPLDRRYAERAPIRLRVSFTSEEGPHLAKGEGAVMDLSKTGCKALGHCPVPKGTSVTLFLYFQDGQPPMCLTGTRISWVSGHSFAAKFPELTQEERKRVQELIWKHATRSQAKQDRTAFRFA